MSENKLERAGLIYNRHMIGTLFVLFDSVVAKQLVYHTYSHSVVGSMTGTQKT